MRFRERQNSSRILSVLQASRVIRLLEPYAANISKRLTKTPKIYFCDTGLVCNLPGIGDTESLVTHPQWGGIFENAVVEEVEKRLLSSGVIPKLSFWRDSNGLEAHLVVERGCEIMQLMEVKPSATFNSKFFSALSRIASIMDVPTERCSVVYAGDESAKMNMGNLVAPSDIYKLAGPWLQDTRLRWTRS